MGGVDRRVQRLEERYRTCDEDERAARRASKERLLERTEQEFRQRVKRLKGSKEAPDLTRIKEKPPTDIAAAYVALVQRGEHTMAKAVKDLYDDAKEERRSWRASIELEDISPGVGRAYDRWFWEMVERVVSERREDSF